MENGFDTLEDLYDACERLAYHQAVEKVRTSTRITEQQREQLLLWFHSLCYVKEHMSGLDGHFFNTATPRCDLYFDKDGTIEWLSDTTTTFGRPRTVLCNHAYALRATRHDHVCMQYIPSWDERGNVIHVQVCAEKRAIVHLMTRIHELAQRCNPHPPSSLSMPFMCSLDRKLLL